MAETSVINRIAIHATAETALPTLPNKGSNIAISSWTSASFVTGGSRQRHGDTFDITDDMVDKEIEREIEEIMQTRGMGAEDLILLKNRVKSFAVTCEDMSEALHALASDITIASNVAQEAATLTFRTAAIEINGLCIEYFPKVAIFIDGNSAGYGAGGKGKVTLYFAVLGTSTVKSGRTTEWYQAA